MLNFLKSKKVGFYIVLADIILAVFLGIFFFATYKNFAPGYGGQGMASNAYANVPEVIGLFIILGAVIDIVALLMPEFLWIHLVAILAYCVSLMKQIYCIPNLIADEINDIHYQGGSFPLNLAWLIIQIVIIASAIVAIFLGFIEQKEEEERKKEKIAGKKLIKVVSGGAAIVVAFAVVMTSYGVIASNVKSGSGAKGEATFAERVKARVKDFESEVVDYDFDPASFKLTEEENEYSTKVSSINSVVGSYNQDQVRKDSDDNEIHKVYTFEGSTAEGWQGDYSLKIVRITLWEDGLYNGNANGNALSGYWYNVDEEGEDCLMLISADGTKNMVGSKLSGAESYYEWLVDVKASYNGGRLIKGNGVKYYPLIGMFVDTGSDKTPQYKVGAEFDISDWTCMQVRNNLAAGSIFDAEHEVSWTKPNMNEVGSQTVKATWKKEGKTFECEVEIEIVE